MDKLRPKLQKSIVEGVQQQKAIQDIPILSENEKTKLLEFAIDLALDQLLQDATWVLSAPEDRLRALEQEIAVIQQTEMTWKQRAVYRFRKHPKRYTLAAVAACFGLYAQLCVKGSFQAAFMNIFVGLQVILKSVLLRLAALRA